MTSESRDVLEWDRERWVEAQQELLSLAEAEKWTKVMAQARVCAQWTYHKSFPEPHWGEFSRHMGSSRGDLIQVSVWALASAVTRAMRKVKPVRLEDLRAFSRGVRGYRASKERWNHSDLRMLGDADVPYFHDWAIDTFESLHKKWPRDTTMGLHDDILFLQSFEQHDAAEELGRASGIILPLWIDLSRQQREILEVLGGEEKGTIGEVIAGKLPKSKHDLHRSVSDIGRPLRALVRLGILSNKRGVGYEVRVWPDGTPAEIREPD